MTKNLLKIHSTDLSYKEKQIFRVHIWSAESEYAEYSSIQPSIQIYLDPELNTDIDEFAKDLQNLAHYFYQKGRDSLKKEIQVLLGIKH